MPQSELRLGMPERGLSDEEAYEDQPPLTSRIIRNARMTDGRSGRHRFSKREGLSKLLSTQVSGSNPVQHLQTIADAGPIATPVSLVEVTDPEDTSAPFTEDWAVDLPGKSHARQIHTDRLGLVYAQDGDATIQTLNRDGEVLGSIDVGIDTQLSGVAQTFIGRIQADGFGNVFVCDVPKITWDTSVSPPVATVIPFVAGVAMSDGFTKVRMYSPTGGSLGSQYQLVWEAGDPMRFIQDIAVSPNGTLYVLAGSGTPGDVGMRVTKYVIGPGVPIQVAETDLAGGSFDETQNRWGQMVTDAGGNVYVAIHPADSEDGFAPGVGVGAQEASYLIKLSSSLEFLWEQVGVANDYGGGLAFNDATDTLYSVGADISADEDGAVVRAILPEDGTRKWMRTEERLIYHIDPYARPDVDVLGNLYIPTSVPQKIGGSAPADSEDTAVVIYDSDGDLVAIYKPPESGQGRNIFWSIAVDKLAVPSKGLPNFLPFNAWNDLTNWDTGTAIATANADEGPFFDGKASLVEDDDAGSAESVSIVEDISTFDVLVPVASIYVKPNSTPSKSTLRLQAGGLIYDNVIDWSGSTPTATLELGGVADGGAVGIAGPVNGYYRIHVRPNRDFPGGSTATITLFPASDGNADTGSLYAWGAKYEDSPTGEPTETTELWGSEVFYLSSQGEPHAADAPVEEPGEFAPVRAVRTIRVEPQAAPVRRRLNLAVANGDVKLWDSTTFTPIVGGQHSQNPQHGLSPAAPYINSTVAFGRIILVDGGRTLVYDIKDGSLSALKSETAGAAPKYAQLCTTWNGRLVLARFRDNPDDWAMSAYGNIFDWDFQQLSKSPAAAVNATLALHAGITPQIITALAPITDDRIAIGCDHSIFEILGNPADGAQLDTVSPTIGMAFGKSWAVDEKGNLWFMSNDGELYVRAAAGGEPRPVNEKTTVRRTQEVDLGTYRFELAWDRRRRGLRIYQIPLGAGGTAVDYWFFDAKHGGFLQDDRVSTDYQARSVLVWDGDDVADRTIIEGSEDGYLRRVDEDTPNDDDTAIGFEVLLGPYRRTDDAQVVLTRLRSSLDPAHGGLSCDIYAEEEPHTLGDPKASLFLRAEAGQRQYLRAVKGNYVYVRLRNHTLNEHVSIEFLYAILRAGGRRRVSFA